MAASHIKVTNEGLRVMFSHLEQFINTLNGTIGTMQTMIGPGGGSDDADYADIAKNFGFSDAVNAHAGWNELLSIQGKLQTDASVDHVMAALTQALNKFRQV